MRVGQLCMEAQCGRRGRSRAGRRSLRRDAAAHAAAGASREARASRAHPRVLLLPEGLSSARPGPGCQLRCSPAPHAVPGCGGGTPSYRRWPSQRARGRLPALTPAGAAAQRGGAAASRRATERGGAASRGFGLHPHNGPPCWRHARPPWPAPRMAQSGERPGAPPGRARRRSQRHCPSDSPAAGRARSPALLPHGYTRC